MRQASRRAGVTCLLLGGALTIAATSAASSLCPPPVERRDSSSLGEMPSDDEIRDWIDSTGFQGILLTEVAPSGADELRLNGWYVRSLREDLVTRFQQDAVLVAAELGMGRVFLGPAFPNAKRPVRNSPPPGYDPGPGVAVTRFDVSPHEAAGRPLPSGDYFFAVLYRGAPSRGSTVTVTAAGDDQPDSASPAAKNSANWPVNVDRTAGALSPPREVGVMLQTSTDRNALSGSYRFPASGGNHMVVVALDGGRSRFTIFELPQVGEPSMGEDRLGSFRVDLSREPPPPGTWLYALGPCTQVTSSVWLSTEASRQE